MHVVLDDMDREKKQKDLLVGSLNAASKYTIGRGKMQKLSGMIITKNIDPESQKMPAKVEISHCYKHSFLSSRVVVYL